MYRPKFIWKFSFDFLIANHTWSWIWETALRVKIDLKRSTLIKKRPATTWNDLQRPRNDPQRPETSYNRTKTLEMNNSKQILRLFDNMGQSILFFNNFSTNIWSFEYCFMENPDENRVLNSYISCVFITWHKSCRIHCHLDTHEFKKSKPYELNVP